MNTQFTQPDKQLAIQTMKQAIAACFNISPTVVAYLSTSLNVAGYTILFDRVSNTCWLRGAATGTVTSWTITNSTMSLVTSAGTYTLYKAFTGYLGRTDGVTAQPGEVGEIITATGSPTTIASASGNNLATIVLTPGVWECIGQVKLTPSGQSSNWSQMHGAISIVSGTAPDFPYTNILRGVFNANGECKIICPTRRFNLSANTTVYCEGGATFADGTMTLTGFIEAVRIR